MPPDGQIPISFKCCNTASPYRSVAIMITVSSVRVFCITVSGETICVPNISLPCLSVSLSHTQSTGISASVSSRSAIFPSLPAPQIITLFRNNNPASFNKSISLISIFFFLLSYQFCYKPGNSFACPAVFMNTVLLQKFIHSLPISFFVIR